ISTRCISNRCRQACECRSASEWKDGGVASDLSAELGPIADARNALSRRQHRFESGRGRQNNQCLMLVAPSEVSHNTANIRQRRPRMRVAGRPPMLTFACAARAPAGVERPDSLIELMSIPFAEADLHERNLKLRVFDA